MSLPATLPMSSNPNSLNNLYCTVILTIDISQTTLTAEHSDLSNDRPEFNHTLSFAEMSSSTKVESPHPIEYKSQDFHYKEHENFNHYIPESRSIKEHNSTPLLNERQANIISIISGYENFIAKLQYQHQTELNRILEEKKSINEKLAHLEYANIMRPHPVIRQDHGLIRPVPIKSTEKHEGTIARLTLENEELKSNLQRLHYISGLWEKYMNNLRVLKSDNDNLTVSLEKKQEIIKDLRHKLSVLVMMNGELEARITTEPVQQPRETMKPRWRFIEFFSKIFKK
ncbi:hypothetical protein HK103_003552 [Boothiomyces macroporosus]|uniref:Uncharacterized protein n=1 Tax=Boothiomyces macroporosus TaxID=261099 RepID=A0AAD5U8P0_9FUNG|nr:hypothetical protein HK103_003552 [Boothiomyces macroporosus]